MAMHYFEVRKLPKDVDIGNELELLLSLFRAKTEEELKQLESLEVPIVTQAIEAYREITVSPQFREIERLRADARHNEASALAHAERKERERWQRVIVEKDAALADKDAVLAEKDVVLAEKDAVLAEKDAAFAATLAEKDAAFAATLADKDALIAEFRARLGEGK
jgi:hypothetical protein